MIAALLLCLAVSPPLYAQKGAAGGARVYFGDYSMTGPGPEAGSYRGGALPVSKGAGTNTFVFTDEATLPDRLRDRPLALVMGPTFYCIEVSLNDRPLHYQGSSRDSAVSYNLSSVIIPVDGSVLGDSQKLRLTVTVSTEAENHPLPEIYCTSYAAAASEVFWKNFVNVNLVQAGFVVALIISLYFMLMYRSHRRLLFFYIASLAFFYSLGTVNMTFNYASNAFTALEKISRIGFPLCILFIFLFSAEYTGVCNRRWLKILDALYCLPFLALTLLAPNRHDVSLRFNNTALFYIAPNLLLTLGIVSAAAAKHRFGKYKPLLFALLVIVLVSVHDMAYVIADRSPYAYLANYGYLFLVVSIFLILNDEQSDLYRTLLVTKREVDELNRNLERKVEARTEEIRDLSLRDPLTGLRNRRYLDEFVVEIAESFRMSKMLAVKNSFDRRDPHVANKVLGFFLLDIDFFKQLNDTHGHMAGDRYLVTLAEKLKRVVRTDDIIIRWGGEEFFVVLNRTTPGYIPEFCRKVLALFRQTEIEVKNSVIVSRTCSIGCISYPADDGTPDLIPFEKSIALCDMALYLAKESGRDRAIHVELDRDRIAAGEIDAVRAFLREATAIDDPIFRRHTVR